MEERKRGYRWLVLAILCFSQFLVGVSIYALPPLFPEMMGDIPLTKTQMGAVMGSIPIAAVFLTLIGGTVSDRIGSKWSYGMAVMLIGLGGVLRGFSGNAAMLISSTVVIGVGVAVMFPNLPKALGAWFEPHELGLAGGVLMAAEGISGAVGMGTSAGIFSPALGGWRNTLLGLGFLVILAGLAWIMIFKDTRTPAPSSASNRQLLRNIRKVLIVKDVWVLSLFSGLINFSLLSALTLLPVTLTERGFGSNAGALVSIFMIVAFILNVLGGFFSDRLGKRKLFLFTGTILFGLCMGLLGFVDRFWLIPALVLGGAGIGIVTPIAMLIPVEMKEIGPSLVATACGVIMSIGCIGGVIGPMICGSIMDFYKAPWPGFLLVGFLAVLAGVSILSIQETGQKKRCE